MPPRPAIPRRRPGGPRTFRPGAPPRCRCSRSAGAKLVLGLDSCLSHLYFPGGKSAGRDRARLVRSPKPAAKNFSRVLLLLFLVPFLIGAIAILIGLIEGL
jgi:hypothetical protein